MNDLELVAAHLQEAYAHVAQGRLAAGAATPGFLLVVTRLGCLWRFREDLTASVVVDLARLAGREGVDPHPTHRSGWDPPRPDDVRARPEWIRKPDPGGT